MNSIPCVIKFWKTIIFTISRVEFLTRTKQDKGLTNFWWPGKSFHIQQRKDCYVEQYHHVVPSIKYEPCFSSTWYLCVWALETRMEKNPLERVDWRKWIRLFFFSSWNNYLKMYLREMQWQDSEELGFFHSTEKQFNIGTLFIQTHPTCKHNRIIMLHNEVQLRQLILLLHLLWNSWDKQL